MLKKRNSFHFSVLILVKIIFNIITVSGIPINSTRNLNHNQLTSVNNGKSFSDDVISDRSNSLPVSIVYSRPIPTGNIGIPKEETTSEADIVLDYPKDQLNSKNSTFSPKKGKSGGKKRTLISRADTYGENEDDDDNDDNDEDNTIDIDAQQYNQLYYPDPTSDEDDDPYNETVPSQEEDDDQNDEDDSDNGYFSIGDLPPPDEPPSPPSGLSPPKFPFPPPPPNAIPIPVQPPSAPPPLKGSVDYVATPLALIAIATPIFTVLYVILGCINYKLAHPPPPTSRSLNIYDSYQPYIDTLYTVSSSVGKALEEFECYEYATCEISNFVRNSSFTSSITNRIERMIHSVTPKEYEPIFKTLLSSLTKKSRRLDENQNCYDYQCSNVLDFFL